MRLLGKIAAADVMTAFDFLAQERNKLSRRTPLRFFQSVQIRGLLLVFNHNRGKIMSETLEHHQEPSDASVSVTEGVDKLEISMTPGEPFGE